MKRLKNAVSLFKTIPSNNTTCSQTPINIISGYGVVMDRLLLLRIWEVSDSKLGRENGCEPLQTLVLVPR